ncbi:hypothetical protein B0I33_11054 [Prauserella shujinwangii]|uniref:Lipoprotein n=1 Tax=Prauserella shujinwangii TaxID=1453103 RepID=A0A2T0LNZ6_9PSEU|nr:hypothetical protein [Prauserella shujinwangii]PRX44955.1 hypothetical protein B0I33_11054 [Prauserella shujinwangii]
MHRLAAARLAVPALVAALMLSGCAAEGDQPSDPLQVVENPVAATPAASPVPEAAPAGTVLPQRAELTAVAADAASRTLAAAPAGTPTVLLYDLDRLGAAPREVALPAPAERLEVTGGQLVATMPDADAFARIALPGGAVETVPVQGGPAGVATDDGGTLVALRDRKAVARLDGGRVAGTVGGDLYSADDVLVAGGKPVVLDRLRTALFELDLAAGQVEEGLRAGQGATNAVVDGFGRVLVVDTRTGALLAFSTDPLLLRQRFPVPGGAYGIAYDARRHLAWVTLTERNEVVGFDVRGGEPAEKYRFPTVRQPNSVTVDERSSRVVVGSAAGEGIQVITP